MRSLLITLVTISALTVLAACHHRKPLPVPAPQSARMRAELRPATAPRIAPPANTPRYPPAEPGFPNATPEPAFDDPDAREQHCLLRF
jgi:hypothetical protein